MKTIASLFAHKTWADAELLDALDKVSPEQHPGEFRAAVRRLNPVCVSDRIFRAHLSGERHPFTATHTVETPDLPAAPPLDTYTRFLHLDQSARRRTRPGATT